MSEPGRSPLIHAGKVDQFALNQFQLVRGPGGAVGVVRTVDGFFAVLNRCPHMGAPVCIGSDVTNSTKATRPFEYDVGYAHQVVRCPWHRWEFRVDTGESVGAVTPLKLITFAVEVHGEDVFIRRPGRENAAL